MARLHPSPARGETGYRAARARDSVGWNPTRLRRAVAAAVGLLLSCGGQAGAADPPQVTRYDLRVQIVPAAERVTAAVKITLANTTSAPLAEIPFLLYRLLTVDAAEGDDGSPRAFRQAVVSMSEENHWQVNSVVVKLPAPLPPGGKTQITLKYSGAILGYTEVMAYVHDRIGPEYTLLRPDALAYPMVAEPSSSSLRAAYDARFTYDLEVTVPKGTVVACGGLPRGIAAADSTETYRFGSRGSTWRMDIAAAPFRVVKNRTGNLVVYALPGDETGAGTLLDEMQRVTQFYSKRFGPSKRATAYTVIEIPDGWGSQASDFYVLQAAAAFRDPKRVHELYHEVAHSWNAEAKPEVKRTRWFDEAFASYLEALALREFDGEQAFDERMTKYREHFRQDAQQDPRNATTPIAEYGKEERGGNSYTKGAWSLAVLERVVGEQAFDRILRAFLADFAERPADFADFQAVAERVSRRDLSRFFHEWISGSESSELLIGVESLPEIAQRYTTLR